MSSVAAGIAKDDSKYGRNAPISCTAPVTNVSSRDEGSGRKSGCSLTATIGRISFEPVLIGEREIPIIGGLIGKSIRIMSIATVSTRGSGHQIDVLLQTWTSGGSTPPCDRERTY
ncbi:hypothetical protein [Caballeronia sp. J97]|uniref:hypothetical protein n=1 Tax=Caballeronia sp. J97 TaxID=2805429 RepID=UPI002AB2AA5C|nr:hypothetical protein [Caballeronia sp. J97]